MIKCTQFNTIHSDVCFQNEVEVETNAFRFGLIIHRNHSFFANVNWTWLKNGLKRAISEFCIRDTRWLNLFKDLHHLDNFVNESYLFLWGLLVCAAREINKMHFTAFSICIICILWFDTNIRLQNASMHPILDACCCPHTGGSSLGLCKICGKTNSTRFFCRVSSIPSKFQFSQIFNF